MSAETNSDDFISSSSSSEHQQKFKNVREIDRGSVYPAQSEPGSRSRFRLSNLDNVAKDARLAKIEANRNLSTTSIEEETKMERAK